MAGTSAFAFVFGAVAGSFVSVVAHRLPRGLSVAGPRSACPRCGARIAAYDNVPIVSWLVLRGRCRSCAEPIAARYPLIELALGLLYVATVLGFVDEPAQMAMGLVFVTLLAAVTLTDLDRRIIPNVALAVAAVAGLAIAAAALPATLPERLLAAAAAGGLLLVVSLAHPRGMGMGDVKLVAVMGLFLGRAVAPALLVGLLAGAIVGIALIARHGAAARKQAIPFGPFLAFGGLVGLFFGDAIVEWYLDGFFRA